MSENESSTNLSPNVSAALSYVALIISGVIIAVVEKDKFAKFHATQSILFGIIWLLLVAIIPPSGTFWMIRQILQFGFVLVWIVLIIKAYQNQKFKLPIIGDLAEGFSKK